MGPGGGRASAALTSRAVWPCEFRCPSISSGDRSFKESLMAFWTTSSVLCRARRRMTFFRPLSASCALSTQPAAMPTVFGAMPRVKGGACPPNGGRAELVLSLGGSVQGADAVDV